MSDIDRPRKRARSHADRHQRVHAASALQRCLEGGPHCIALRFLGTYDAARIAHLSRAVHQWVTSYKQRATVVTNYGDRWTTRAKSAHGMLLPLSNEFPRATSLDIVLHEPIHEMADETDVLWYSFRAAGAKALTWMFKWSHIHELTLDCDRHLTLTEVVLFRRFDNLRKLSITRLAREADDTKNNSNVNTVIPSDSSPRTVSPDEEIGRCVHVDMALLCSLPPTLTSLRAKGLSRLAGDTEGFVYGISVTKLPNLTTLYPWPVQVLAQVALVLKHTQLAAGANFVGISPAVLMHLKPSALPRIKTLELAIHVQDRRILDVRKSYVDIGHSVLARCPNLVKLSIEQTGALSPNAPLVKPDVRFCIAPLSDKLPSLRSIDLRSCGRPDLRDLDQLVQQSANLRAFRYGDKHGAYRKREARMPTIAESEMLCRISRTVRFDVPWSTATSERLRGSPAYAKVASAFFTGE